MIIKPRDPGYRVRASKTYCWGVFPITVNGEVSLSGVEGISFRTITHVADKGTAIQKDVTERVPIHFGVRWFNSKREAENYGCRFGVGLCAIAKRFQS